MTIIESHYVDQSETFIRLYNEGKTPKQIQKTLQIGQAAYNTYLRDNKQHLKLTTKTCPVCGKTFSKKNNNHRYCSLECVKEVKRRDQRKKRMEGKICATTKQVD